MDIPFLKKLSLPEGGLFTHKPANIVGIDIGTFSTKVVQLKYEKERGILETYGELLNESYFAENPGSSLIHRSDTEIVTVVQEILKEANVTTKEAVFSIPAGSSFITTIQFPHMLESELKEAIPFETRRYIPIPVSEVVLDWEVLGPTEDREKLDILLIAVPRETVEKFKRVSEQSGLRMRSLEVETFSLVRSLGAGDLTPTMYINLGHLTSAIAMADKGRLRVSHSFARGSSELTKILSRSLGVTKERAESVKREVGMSEKMEEKEIASVISPFIEVLFLEVERFLSIYNRKAPRTIQKINLTGGGSNLKGIVEYAVSKFGIEVTRGNPFSQVVAPAFMQPTLREIGPGFSVAVGLALHELTSQ